MHMSLPLIRILFLGLSLFLMTTYMLSIPTGSTSMNVLLGVALGCGFSALLVVFDRLFRRLNLRAFNTMLIGMFLGYLMGQALVLILDAVLDMSSLAVVLQPQTTELIKIALFLFGIYMGTMMVLRCADEFHLSIPFVKLSSTQQKKKDLLIDPPALADPRIIDLCCSGLVDQQLVLPRFIVKELQAQLEMEDEMGKAKARRCLDVVKRLEDLSELQIRFNDTDFPEIKDVHAKLLRLARLLNAAILSGDSSRIQLSTLEGVRVINIHALSNALKPLTPMGEKLKIKIQRYGKEPRQGVGYLEDGTMVVVNGGGNFIGEVIDALVLSVKHTAAGRMIFCNTCDEPTLAGAEHHDDSYSYER